VQSVEKRKKKSGGKAPHSKKAKLRCTSRRNEIIRGRDLSEGEHRSGRRRLKHLHAGDVQERTDNNPIRFRVHYDYARIGQSDAFGMRNRENLAVGQMNRERLKRLTMQQFSKKAGIHAFIVRIRSRG
jgi:hypothetical protein